MHRCGQYLSSGDETVERDGALFSLGPLLKQYFVLSFPEILRQYDCGVFAGCLDDKVLFFGKSAVDPDVEIIGFCVRACQGYIRAGEPDPYTPDQSNDTPELSVTVLPQ